MTVLESTTRTSYSFLCTRRKKYLVFFILYLLRTAASSYIFNLDSTYYPNRGSMDTFIVFITN
jgi:hypothetical protein